MRTRALTTDSSFRMTQQHIILTKQQVTSLIQRYYPNRDQFPNSMEQQIDTKGLYGDNGWLPQWPRRKILAPPVQTTRLTKAFAPKHSSQRTKKNAWHTNKAKPCWYHSSFSWDDCSTGTRLLHIHHGVGIHILNIVQIFEHIDDFLHFHCVIAGQFNFALRTHGDIGLFKT